MRLREFLAIQVEEKKQCKELEKRIKIKKEQYFY